MKLKESETEGVICEHSIHALKGGRGWVLRELSHREGL